MTWLIVTVFYVLECLYNSTGVIDTIPQISVLIIMEDSTVSHCDVTVKTTFLLKNSVGPHALWMEVDYDHSHHVKGNHSNCTLYWLVVMHPYKTTSSHSPHQHKSDSIPKPLLVLNSSPVSFNFAKKMRVARFSTICLILFLRLYWLEKPQGTGCPL